MNGVDLDALWTLWVRGSADSGFIDFAWLVVKEVTERIREASERHRANV